MMMRTMVLRNIKLFMVVQLLIFVTYFISFEFFINVEIAFLSSFFIILGSMYTYRKMVHTKLQNEDAADDGKRDLLDTIEDPYELYDDTPLNEAPVEELDLKAIVKEEKKKIKTLSLKNMKHGAKGSFSLFRLVPYLFLVLGFIALNNNELLNIAIYLPSLLVGIIVGSVSGKAMFT